MKGATEQDPFPVTPEFDKGVGAMADLAAANDAMLMIRLRRH